MFREREYCILAFAFEYITAHLAVHCVTFDLPRCKCSEMFDGGCDCASISSSNRISVLCTLSGSIRAMRARQVTYRITSGGPDIRNVQNVQHFEHSGADRAADFACFGPVFQFSEVIVSFSMRNRVSHFIELHSARGAHAIVHFFELFKFESYCVRNTARTEFECAPCQITRLFTPDLSTARLEQQCVIDEKWTGRSNNVVKCSKMFKKVEVGSIAVQ